MPTLLTSDLRDLHRTTKLMVQEKQGTGRLICRGVFAEGGVPTGNNRVYPLALWEREIKNLTKDIEAGKVVGTLDHPADGKTRLREVSHKITSLKIEGNQVIGEAEIISGTESGKALRALIEAGVAIGMSSRGNGSVQANNEGKEIVQDDFKLMTFDFVSDPANSGAYPSFFTEQRNRQMSEGNKMTLEELRAQHPNLIEQAIEEARLSERTKTRDELRSLFEVELLDHIAENRESVAREVKSALLSDPDVAAAKGIVEVMKRLMAPVMLDESGKVVVAEKLKEIETRDAEIKRLNEELGQLKGRLERSEAEIEKRDHALEKAIRSARELGFKLYVEQNLAEVSSDDRETVIELLGDLNQYPTIDKLGEKMAASMERAKTLRQENQRVLERKRGKEEETLTRTETLLKEGQATIATLTEEKERTQQAAEEAVELSHKLGLRAYILEQTEDNPRKFALRKLCANAATKADVDRILTESVDSEKPSEEFDRLHQRMAKGKVSTAQDEATRPPDKKSNAMRSVRRLSGLSD